MRWQLEPRSIFVEGVARGGEVLSCVVCDVVLELLLCVGEILLAFVDVLEIIYISLEHLRARHWLSRWLVLLLRGLVRCLLLGRLELLLWLVLLLGRLVLWLLRLLGLVLRLLGLILRLLRLLGLLGLVLRDLLGGRDVCHTSHVTQTTVILRLRVHLSAHHILRLGLLGLLRVVGVSPEIWLLAFL